MRFANKIQHYLRRSAATFLPPALSMLLLTSVPSTANASNYIACSACGYQSLVWSEGEFDQVHRVANGGAEGNVHPQTLAVDGLGKALLKLHIKSGGTAALAMLNPESASSLARGLSAGLSKATAQQDVLFFATSGQGGGLFANKLGNSGRAFVDSHGLNLIFGEVAVDFVGAYRGTKKPRSFDFGSRASASGVAVELNGLSQPRNDWVIIPLASLRAGEPQAASLPAPAQQAAVRDEQYYVAQEMRLKGLKRLHEQKLITDEEFQAKRGEILKAW